MEASRVIRSLVIAALLFPPAAAGAPDPLSEEGPPSDEPAASPEAEASVERYRTPVELLTEWMIGTASMPVRVDWRKSKVSFGLFGSELVERNNFGSTRVGALARVPFGDFLGELAISRVFTWGSDSTEKLARTPYRQYGRPARFELDINVGYPIAEGVATALPRFFPATQMVFSADAGFRYLFYPESLAKTELLDITKTVLSAQLTERERENLEAVRPPGMHIDGARYGLHAGFSLDLYFQSGAFVSPRVMVSIPLLSPINGTGLGFWWDVSLAAGWTLR
jgi:hypothetical protein